MIEYVCQTQSQQGIPLSSLVQRAQTSGGGPLPYIASDAGAATPVYERQEAVVQINPQGRSAVAMPLITCAGIVMASQDPAAPAAAVVRHAGSGQVTQADIQRLNGLIGGRPAATLLVVFVVSQPWDARYQADAMQFQQFGVPPNSVVYIQRFQLQMFGIGRDGSVGAASRMRDDEA